MAKFIRSLMVVAIVVLSYVSPAVADDLQTSGKNGLLENPFVAYGVNPISKLVTGYLVGLRTSPGRTDECRFVFAGGLDRKNAFSVKYLSEVGGYEDGGATSSAVVETINGNLQLRVKKNQLGGDCEWILPFIGEPRVTENAGEVTVSFGALEHGAWIGVYAIKSQRAPFYKSPDISAPQIEHFIQGEEIYVYDEQPNWYYVKYERRKKITVGWVKKSDTVQIKLNKTKSS